MVICSDWLDQISNIAFSNLCFPEITLMMSSWNGQSLSQNDDIISVCQFIFKRVTF